MLQMKRGIVMSKLQKILLLLSGIFYVLVIIGFFTPTSWISFIFFILHSSTLLYFTYLCQTKQGSSSYNNESESLKQKIEFLRHELQVLSEKNSELTTTNHELSHRLLKEQENSPGDTLFSNTWEDPLLPPVEEEFTKESVDVVRIVRETITELQSFADSVGLIIRISAAVDPLFLKASSQRMRILFRNIIDNSIKYMKRSGTLVITLSIVGDDIFIVLKDNGKGLSTEETPHIFELNYQGSNRISGNGLGLTQAKAIVESYGGTIYAKSTPDLGMGIYIQIPLT